LDPAALPILPMVRNVTLGTLTGEIHLDAVIDTGSTYCVVPPSIARALGFDFSNRLWRRAVGVVGNLVEMDMHHLEYVTVGSAKVYSVLFGVHNTFPRSRDMLVGLTFMSNFRTTFDFDEKRVLFRRDP